MDKTTTNDIMYHTIINQNLLHSLSPVQEVDKHKLVWSGRSDKHGILTECRELGSSSHQTRPHDLQRPG